MTQAGSASYSYDGANRLKMAGGGTSTYGYDGDGKRVRVTDGGAAVYYVYSSKLGQVAMEVNASGVRRAYLYAGGRQVAQQSVDGQFYWLHTNHLGSSRAMTDVNGNLVYKGQFDPYGQVLLEWGSASLNTKKFTGYERDGATGLDYADARMYNSLRGRFMQPDQLSLQSVNFSRDCWLPGQKCHSAAAAQCSSPLAPPR
jgi:RHS repeat-associated protein